MPGNDAVLFFSETRVVEVKEIIMSGVFSADAEGALWLPFHWLRLGSTGGLWERTGVEEPQHRILTQSAALACWAAPNFRFCFVFVCCCCCFF